METYKTYITIENPDRVVLSSEITDADIEAEINAYRQGK